MSPVQRHVVRRISRVPLPLNEGAKMQMNARRAGGLILNNNKHLSPRHPK